MRARAYGHAASSGLAALVRWYTAKELRAAIPSPSINTSLVQRTQAASWRGQHRAPTHDCVRALRWRGAGSSPSVGLSHRDQAVEFTCPAIERQRQTQRSENGRSGSSIA